MSEVDIPSCPICDSIEAKQWNKEDGYVVSCPRCGNFELSRTLSGVDLEEKYGPDWLLSAAIRNQYASGKNIRLTTRTVETLLEVAGLPDNPFDSINLLLQHLRRRASAPGRPVVFDQTEDYPLVYARDPEEFQYYITKARELDLIEPGPDNRGYRLGLEGWRRLQKLDEDRSRSNKAFVAMWFDEEMDPAYSDGFVPALNETGYNPVRIDMQEHNEKIDNRIIAEIRQNGLLVADFTGHRGGVYFEAGFAMGLGLPVIWTCHSDHFDNLHFDTRQYNHIKWHNPEDLEEQLVQRIRATLPNRDESTV